MSFLFIIYSKYLFFTTVKWNPYWIYSHMMFHLAVSLSEILVIYCTIINPLHLLE